MPTKIPNFPFLPKSTSFLKQGMIWGIRLRDGSYTCGRVLCVEGKHRKKRVNLFWAGLLQWHSSEPPTTETVAGAPVLWQGHFNVRSFKNSDSKMLGIVPLESDGLEIPPILTSLMNGVVVIGYNERRQATDEEFRTLPIMTFRVDNDSFREVAEDVFLDGKPMRWARSERDNEILDSLGMKKPSDLKRVESELAKAWVKKQKSRSSRSKSRTQAKRRT